MATAQSNTAAPEKKKERPSALRSIIAGSTAGAVEIGTLQSLHMIRCSCKERTNFKNSHYVSC